MKKKFKVLLMTMLSCVLAIGCLIGLVGCGGESTKVDKVYVARTSRFAFAYEGQEIAQMDTQELTLFTDGTYKFVTTKTLNLNGGTGGGFFTNVSFGTFTSVAEDPEDEENTIFVLTLAAPTRVIHHDSYDWGTQLYIDTDDLNTYTENEAGDKITSFEEQVNVIRSGLAVNYIGGTGTYSMTITVDNKNGEIKEFKEDRPEQPQQ